MFIYASFDRYVHIAYQGNSTVYIKQILPFVNIFAERIFTIFFHLPDRACPGDDFRACLLQRGQIISLAGLVEVVALGIDDDHSGEVLHNQFPDGFCTQVLVSDDLGGLDATA